jgi:preprotein translocase subunit YajC
MPTVAKVVVDDSLTKMGLPMGSLLIMVILVPFAFIIRKQKKRNKSIRSHLIVVCLLVAGGVLLFPYFHVSVARPSIMAPKITDKEAVVILEDLLKNIYRSFDFREEEDVYDRLATSVNGDLLTDIYLQNRKSMVVTQAGGARAKVKEIEIQDVSVKHLDDRPLALLFHSKWTAMGTVGHWGHIHTRKNQYEANITVEPVDGAWKITNLELLEEKRIDPYAKPKT